MPAGSHPAAEMFAPGTGFTRERISHLNLLEDGTVVLLGRLRGDPDRARRVLANRPDVLGYSISDAGDPGALGFVHARPPPSLRRFLSLPRRHEVFFDFPIEGSRDGGLRVVLVGESNDDLAAALADVPPELDLEVERIGPYPAESGDVAALLTDRQREVLDVALDLGYYEVPRAATHADIAAALGLSTGTVGEHLQKVERRVFGSLFG